jgi:hypothetical protein
MKKLLLFPLFILAISILAPSCTKDDNEIFPPGNDSIANNDTLGTNGSISGDTISGDTVQNVPIILKYEGDLIVNGNNVKENAVCGINIKRSQITLYLYKAKFAEMMPELNITVPDIPFNKQTTMFEGDTIVPLLVMESADIPMPDKTFTQIAGSVIKDSILSFDGEVINLGTISFNGKFIGK